MSLKCPECGSILAEGDSFCEPCGVKGEQCEDDSSDSTVRKKIKSQCSDLDVFYNVSRIFVEGSILPFDFRITPRVDGITDLCIELETANIPRLTETFDEYLEKDSEYESYISFTPPKGCNGLLPFRIYIGYKKNEKTLWFIAREKHKIYKGDEPARKVVENLKIELNANIGHGQASDGIQQRLDGLQSLVPSALDPAAELQKVDLPPDWKPLYLNKCHSQHALGETKPALSRLGHPPRSATAWRISLQDASGNLLHLLSRPTVQLGRNSGCDIVTRIMEADGNALRKHNAMISRNHCNIQNRGVDCCIDDIGFDQKSGQRKPSAYGTYLDNNRISSGQSAVLPLDNKFTISLAGQCSDEASLALNGRIYTCRSMGKCESSLHERCSSSEPACMLLERQDGLCETFVLLWKYCNLNALSEQLSIDIADLCLFRYEGAFAYIDMSRKHDCGWLEPGKSIKGIKVIEYKQFGKWAEDE